MLKAVPNMMIWTLELIAGVLFYQYVLLPGPIQGVIDNFNSVTDSLRMIGG